MNRQISIAVRAAQTGGLGLLLANPAATASGFSIPELSALGTGMANAVAANPKEIGAFVYNPSAMGFHDGSSIAPGTPMINPKFDATTTSGNYGSENASWFAAPIFQAALKVNDQCRIGVGVSAPFGLETRWRLSIPAISGTLQQPAGAPRFSRERHTPDRQPPHRQQA